MQKKNGSSKRKVRSASRQTTVGKRERRRLIQLLICLSLFLIVIFGKGSIPKGTLQYIQANTDFEGAFSALGEAVANGEPVIIAFGNLLVNVFTDGETNTEPTTVNTAKPGMFVQSAVYELKKTPDRDVILSRLGIELQAINTDAESDEVHTKSPEEQLDLVVSSKADPYTGPDLPAHATMEYNELGLTNTVTPVMGEITSAYGYRDHPIDGTHSFHSGVDLAADVGTPIAAFAAGTVDYIGESDAYGLYIQLNHGNGITTFYCHCSELYARKGEAVSAGQIIAAVGDTGNATGAHLHLELEQDGVLLNPEYYIETVE